MAIRHGKTFRLFLLYLIICIYRTWNALEIETQFDPDEYWQTLEPAYNLVFTENEGINTWEWKFRGVESSRNFKSIVQYGPVRSHVSILPTYVFYQVVKIFGIDTSWMISRGPLVINAILVAATTDLSIYILGGWWALFASITNWFHGYALVRTYSNSLESMLLSLGMAIIILNDKKLGNHKIAFLLGGFSVTIRFTALAAWIPLGILTCHRLAEKKSQPGKFKLKYLCNICGLYGMLGVVFGCIIDYFFYGYISIPFVSNTYFNAILGLGSLYGTHPFYWYFFMGLPAICGILLPFFLFKVFECCRQKRKSSSEQVDNDLAWIIFIYTLIHSFSPHKEFRFLLPILPLVCVLAGRNLQTICQKIPKMKWYLVLILIIFNYPHLYFLSKIHQHGPIGINREILKIVSLMDSNEHNLTIHYLMGCHSTPLYSHLHTDNVKFQAWTLDCSPTCRDPNNNLVCESEQFTLDPSSFIQQTYYHLAACDNSDVQECTVTDNSPGSLKPIPDFVAIFQMDACKTYEILSEMKFEQVAKVRHAIKKINFFSDSSQNKETDDLLIGIDGMVSIRIEFESILLFQRKHIL